jgi:hypothetical protein
MELARLASRFWKSGGRGFLRAEGKHRLAGPLEMAAEIGIICVPA